MYGQRPSGGTYMQKKNKWNTKWRTIITIVSSSEKPNEVILCFDDSTIKTITPKEPIWNRPYYVGQKLPFKQQRSRV